MMLSEAAANTTTQRPVDFHRPTYHFLPRSNWMNDPNGFIHWQGRYHLFYQYNPTGATWGNMHWGHTVSNDLVHWQDLPMALAPTPGGPDGHGCFSGCAVDNDGVPTLVYTGSGSEKHDVQTQCLATSRDGLLSWDKDPRNPILSTIPPMTGQSIDFRDPFVWREADGWYMVLGSRIRDEGGVVFLYRSADLADWAYLGPLFEGSVHKTGYVWECPNFFRLGEHWVLIISAHPLPGQSNGFVYYFVGDYANHRFTPIAEGMLDYGAMYAPLSTLDAAGRRLLIGWIREQRSTDAMIQAGWSGAQGIPRVLSLDAQHRLLMTPVPEVASLRKSYLVVAAQALNGESTVDVAGWALEIEGSFSPAADGTCAISVGCSVDGSERTDMEYDAARQQLTVRTISQGSVQAVQYIPHSLAPNEALTLRLLLDGSVLEVIANGRTSVIHRIYSTHPEHDRVRFSGLRTHLNSLNIWTMASIW
jgi:beta-fructofuranosidase